MTKTEKTLAISDWPHECRLKLRRDLENAGAHVRGYAEHGIDAAVPVDAAEVTATALAWRLAITNDYFFPLGSDKPREALRHVSPTYGGAPSCWRVWHIEPRG